ncbi:MAG: hypothetical protein K2K53_10885, partial [Oscillospiraceae bacterium]|nr:hypothetical protein [Oscillospiraceae bacterium]
MIGGYVFARKLKTTNGVVALCAIMLTTYSGLVPASKVLSNFANANVLLITGMFIVSAGFNRTQAVNKMSSLVAKVSGGKFSVMLIGYCLVTFLLTNFIPSPVAVFTIVSPMLVASCYGLDVSPSKAVYSIGLVAIGTCVTLPIGSGAATYATQNGYMESYGYTAHQMQLLDPFKGRILISLFILVYAMFIAPKFAPAEPSIPLTNAPTKKGSGNEQPPLDPVREFLGYAIFIATTVGLIFSSQLHLANWQIAMTGAALVVATGVLKPKEATNALPVRIVLMLVAALAAGGAMVSCGLGDMIGDMLANAMGGTHNGYVIGAAFFIIPFLLTQLMQN